jgi:hypothetical protein
VLLSDAAAEAGLGFVVGFALMNLAWSPGLLLGSTFAGGVAQVSTDAVPFAVGGVLCLGALAFVGPAFAGRPFPSPEPDG